jgi:hypothetical protein
VTDSNRRHPACKSVATQFHCRSFHSMKAPYLQGFMLGCMVVNGYEIFAPVHTG